MTVIKTTFREAITPMYSAKYQGMLNRIKEWIVKDLKKKEGLEDTVDNIDFNKWHINLEIRKI
jgi:hypothetical protein